MAEQDWQKTVGVQMRDKGCEGIGRTPEQNAKAMIEVLVAALPQSDAVFTAQRQGDLLTARGVAVEKVLRAAYYHGFTDFDEPRKSLEPLLNRLACEGPRSERNGKDGWCNVTITKLATHLANKGEGWPGFAGAGGPGVLFGCAGSMHG